MSKETHAEPSYNKDGPCPFCLIASKHPPQKRPIHPSNDTIGLENPFVCHNGDAHILLSTPTILAFLDIMPLTHGHTLVIPRNHSMNIAETSATDMMSLGAYLPLLARCVMKAVGWKDFNIIQNNGAAASQVIYHTHFHIIPRKPLDDPTFYDTPYISTIAYGQTRRDLDDRDGAKLAKKIRGEIWKEFVGLKGKRAAEDPVFQDGELHVLSLL
ncbi:HIT-like domain-containing protein [Terfezia claveryi]|nr:HIT-like domain-containing protein [Terfezia claveryi]